MAYAHEHCTTPKTSDQPIGQIEAERLLEGLPGWGLCNAGKSLVRNYNPKNYADALKLVQCISVIAEQENHHPDISFGWGYVTVNFTTHTINGLHMNDFIMAAKLNDCV